MCAMDRVAHFPVGHLAPPPMGQTATPAAKKLANACVNVSIYRQYPRGAGPYVRMPAAGFGHEEGVETLPRRVKNLPHSNIRCSRALRMGLMAHFYFIWTIE
jgi:hypothetical protein